MKKALSLILAMLMVASVFSVCAVAATSVVINNVVATYSGVELQWNAVAGVKQYHVVRQNSSDDPGEEVGSTKDTYFVDNTVEINGTYNYTVVAEYENGEYDDVSFDDSNIITYNHVRVTSLYNNYNGVNIKWNADGNRFFVFRQDAPSKKFVKIADVKKASYVDKDVEYMKNYKYAIAIVDADGGYDVLDQDNPIDVVYNLLDVEAPTSTNKGIILKWAAVEGATGYEIYRKQGSNKGKLIATTTDLSYTDADVKDGKEYSYVIVAIDSNYETNKEFSYNNGVKVGHQVLKFKKPVMEYKGVTISWTDLESATAYYLYRREVISNEETGDSYGTEKLIKADIQKTTYTDKTVKEGKTYQYALAVQYANGDFYAVNFDDGLELTYVARVCKRVNDKGEHVYYSSKDKVVIDKEPTVYAIGYKHYICAECGRHSSQLKVAQLAPKAPKILTLANNAKGVKLVWEIVDSAELYVVYRKVKGGSWRVIRMTTENNIIDDTAVSGKYYSYSIKAINKNALVRPIDAFRKNNRNVLEWKKDSYTANAYLIYRKDKIDGVLAWQINDFVPNNKVVKNDAGKYVKTYTDKSTKANKKYCVRSVMASEMGKVESLRIVATPENLSVVNKHEGIFFKWDKVEGATSYRVYRKRADLKGWAFIKEVKKASYLDKSAKDGVDYVYTVRAVYNGVYSKYQNNGVEITRLTTPDLKSAKSNREGILVTWDDVVGAKQYIVYRKTNNSGWKVLGKVNDMKSTRYLDKSAKKGVKYTYTVRAVADDSRSSYESAGVSCKDKY